ncbi:MAG TPA: alpha/beta hydrolase [Solirubrobacterales bacterium]|nr:alpha/beta hydrolase [Solirubrobacterales bacterium]
MALRRLGAGPPLLLINGYAATSEDWDPTFLAALAESFEVICPDNRGVGGSELGAEELTIDGMAADLEALLDALEVERATVVGWSMGGFVAQRLAAHAPARVAALALLATDPGGPDSVPALAADWSRLTDHSGSPRERATRLISLLFPPDLAPEIDRRFGEIVAAAQAQLSPRTLRAQEGAMESWHRTRQSRPGAESPPALIAHGELDAVIPATNAAALAALWSGARVEILPGCAHALMAQEPRRVADLIRVLAE